MLEQLPPFGNGEMLFPQLGNLCLHCLQLLAEKILQLLKVELIDQPLDILQLESELLVIFNKRNPQRAFFGIIAVVRGL
ncbi:hypothetical protein D3C81_1828270 [compost metagenome]